MRGGSFKDGVSSLLNAIVRMSQVEFSGKQILGRSIMCRMFIQEALGSTSVEEKGQKEDQQEKWSLDLGPTTGSAEPQGSSGTRMVLQNCSELGQKASSLHSHWNVGHPKKGHDFG